MSHGLLMPFKKNTTCGVYTHTHTYTDQGHCILCGWNGSARSPYHSLPQYYSHSSSRSRPRSAGAERCKEAGTGKEKKTYILLKITTYGFIFDIRFIYWFFCCWWFFFFFSKMDYFATKHNTERDNGEGWDWFSFFVPRLQISDGHDRWLRGLKGVFKHRTFLKRQNSVLIKWTGRNVRSLFSFRSHGASVLFLFSSSLQPRFGPIAFSNAPVWNSKSTASLEG